MEENKKSNKKGIIIVGVSAILLIAILGISFAIWNYSRVGDNQILVAGDVYMKFKETPALTIENAIPSEGPGEKYFEFTIEGKNTYSKPIWYEIDLQYGEDHETRKTRIKDNLLKFRLVEIKDGNEETVVDNASYSNLTNQKIWINTIDANTRTNVEITYRLYMWISSETIIGNTSDAVYDMDTWNNDVFASIKVNVAGDFNEKELEKEPTGVDIVKDTLGQPGGVIGVTNESEPTTDKSADIREYRYSDLEVNNYVYFNCDTNTIYSEASNKCELWRIVGIFKDENEIEYIKIVSDTTLSEDMLPYKYIVNEIEYYIGKQSDWWAGAWNRRTNDERINQSDWTIAGLQYWLNTETDDNHINQGYLSYLKGENLKMIAETKYYLGTVTALPTYDSKGVIDTPKQAYKNERAITGCENGVGPVENSGVGITFEATPNCRVWANNKATWTGKISLLYPSDYGFSTRSDYWDTKMEDESFNVSASNTSWLQKNHKEYEWLISPTSASDGNSVATWKGENYIIDIAADNNYIEGQIRPTLYLKNNVKITAGDGSERQPYLLDF